MFAPALFQSVRRTSANTKLLIFLMQHTNSTFQPESFATLITITLSNGSYMFHPMNFRIFQRLKTELYICHAWSKSSALPFWVVFKITLAISASPASLLDSAVAINSVRVTILSLQICWTMSCFFHSPELQLFGFI